jgi:hypothetical protein
MLLDTERRQNTKGALSADSDSLAVPGRGIGPRVC